MERRRAVWKKLLFPGGGWVALAVLLGGASLALSGVATQIVRDGYGSDYPGMLIYVAAMYAFYSLTIAVVNTVRYRKFQSPVLSAAKAVNLTTALVSIFKESLKNR